MSKKIEAIIWDCDGCLVDSEHLACKVAVDYLNRAGCAISIQDFISRFCGQGTKSYYKTIMEETGIDVAKHIDDEEKQQKIIEVFEQNLLIMKGVRELLEKYSHLPMAVASGSALERVQKSLAIVGLSDLFWPHIYSSSLVSRGKPAPDIFLYAAAKLRVDPTACLVIEDSNNGVLAGKAAGMTVFGFSGGSHILDKKTHEKILLDSGADLTSEELSNAEKLLVG